jgi:tetratricopeptide (TPR) repeat protein
VDRETLGDSVAVDFPDELPLAMDSRAECEDDMFPEVSGCSYDTLCRRFKDALMQQRNADICRTGIALAARLYTQPGREAAVEEVLRCTLLHCDDTRPYHEYKATRLLAMLYNRLGRQQEAIPLLSLSLDMSRLLNDKKNALVLASALSKCYLDKGNFDASIPLSLASLQDHEAPDFDWELLQPPSPGRFSPQA